MTARRKPAQPLTLAADPMNPNRMTPEDKARMAKSLPEFGDLGCIILNRRTGTLIGGHQRTDVMKGATIETTDLPKPEPDGTVARGWLVYQGRKFALRVVDWIESKAMAAMVAANRFGRVGQDDAAMLKDLLQELDSGSMDMDLTGFDAGELERLMLQEHQSDGLSDDYTHKVDAPVYEPKGDKPPIAELTNHDRAGELIAAIKAANLPPDVALFLTTAAARHVVFDYGKIAEFYCHADKATQALMEDSALVIIDFKKAMQLGYVKLKQEIADALESERERDDENE